VARVKKQFVCNACNYVTARWVGVCPKCEEAGSFEEQLEDPVRRGRSANTSPAAEITSVQDISRNDVSRIATGIGELDRVLGGGIVPGSGVVLTGEPGAGKSTLASEVVIQMARLGQRVGYFSGEESMHQVKMRLERLGLTDADEIGMSSEVGVERICKSISTQGFDFIVIDSIQTVYSEDIPGTPGSVSQVKESAHQIMRYAKQTDTSVLLIGQVVKSGEMAGPRALEHLVDAVINFEGDRREQHRILRAHKNRFGTTDEVGVFEMTSSGLVGIEDIASLFIEDSQGLPGSCPTIVIEGSRPVICEIQALASPSDLANPIRAVRGIDSKRVQMLLAVLSSRTEVTGTRAMDIYVNVSGSLKIDDPGCDLAVALAVASAVNKRPLNHQAVAYGEISLLGLAKKAAQQERRNKEAKRLGYQTVATEETVRVQEILKQAGIVGSDS